MLDLILYITLFPLNVECFTAYTIFSFIFPLTITLFEILVKEFLKNKTVQNITAQY